MKLLKMEVGTIAFVCGLFSAIRGLEFPPVGYRFPIPSTAVNAPLGDQRIFLGSDPAAGGYPNQRWIYPPNIFMPPTPPADVSPVPPERDETSRPSENETPEQVGRVATPLPDGILDENSIDFPPDDFTDRNSFIPLQTLAGKSQRPAGAPRPAITVYRFPRWEPISFPEDFQPGQGSGADREPPSISSIPATAQPVDDASVSKEQFWLSPSGLILPLASVTGATSKPAEVIPLQPVIPPPSKGYAVPDIPPRPNLPSYDFRNPQIPSNLLNIRPRPDLVVPSLDSIRTSDPYLNGYIAALNNYKPSPPDRIRNNPGSGTVTLSNAYGDLWVLKKDSDTPYFERVKIAVPTPGSVFGSQNTF